MFPTQIIISNQFSGKPTLERRRIYGSNRDFQDLMNIAIECQRASEQNDILKRIQLDFAFHTAFVTLSGNHELTKIQEQITKRGRLMQLQ